MKDTKVLYEMMHVKMTASRCLERLVQTSSITKSMATDLMEKIQKFLHASSLAMAVEHATTVRNTFLKYLIENGHAVGSVRHVEARRIFNMSINAYILEQVMSVCACAWTTLNTSGGQGPVIENINKQTKLALGVSNGESVAADVIIYRDCSERERQLTGFVDGVNHQKEAISYMSEVIKKTVQRRRMEDNIDDDLDRSGKTLKIILFDISNYLCISLLIYLPRNLLPCSRCSEINLCTRKEL